MDPKASLIVAPADHLILDKTAFTKVCLESLDFVNKHSAFITLGIKPTYPNTGYGYIQYDQHSVSDNVYKVKTFTEKPNLELAKTFLASGDFLWNAGIFVWQVKTIIAAFEKYLPEMFDVFSSEKDKFNTPAEKKALEHIYPLMHQYLHRLRDHGKGGQRVCDPFFIRLERSGYLEQRLREPREGYLDNAVAGDNVIVIDATRCMVHAPNDKLLLSSGAR